MEGAQREAQPALPVLRARRRRDGLRSWVACGYAKSKIAISKRIPLSRPLPSRPNFPPGGGSADSSIPPSSSAFELTTPQCPATCRIEDRMVAADLVEIPARQHAAFGHLRIVVTAAAQPASGGRVRELGAELRGDLGERGHGVDREIEVQHVLGGDGEVRVGVVETRHDHGVAMSTTSAAGNRSRSARSFRCRRSFAGRGEGFGLVAVMVTMRRARKIVGDMRAGRGRFRRRSLLFRSPERPRSEAPRRPAQRHGGRAARRPSR